VIIHGHVLNGPANRDLQPAEEESPATREQP